MSTRRHPGVFPTCSFVIVSTVLEPLARWADLHPVQFAIIAIVSLAFGLVTPPYGLCLMISCAVAGVRLRYALKDIMIMLVPMIRPGCDYHLARDLTLPAAAELPGVAAVALAHTFLKSSYCGADEVITEPYP